MRIVVSPPNGKITLRYATAEHGWQPQYNLHPEQSGTARLQFSARVTETLPGYHIRVSPGLLVEHGKAETVPTELGSALIASYHLRSEEHTV